MFLDTDPCLTYSTSKKPNPFYLDPTSTPSSNSAVKQSVISALPLWISLLLNKLRLRNVETIARKPYWNPFFPTCNFFIIILSKWEPFRLYNLHPGCCHYTELRQAVALLKVSTAVSMCSWKITIKRYLFKIIMLDKLQEYQINVLTGNVRDQSESKK